MRDSIIRKLDAVLSNGIDSECKVVYVLAEVRKLLEKYPPSPAPFALKLYCHWALHVDLTNPGTTMPFLQKVDAYAASSLGGNDVIAEHRALRELIFIDTFKSELRTLLGVYGLPTALCDDVNRWHEFLVHYAGVVEDGSISCHAAGSHLKYVREVTFAKGGRTIPDSHLPFTLAWTITLHDDRAINVDLSSSTLSNGALLISHAVRVI